MNYIKKLERQNRRAAAEIAGLRATIQDLQEYLASPKFHEETWVDVKDVFLRLDEGERRTTRFIDETPE